MCPGCYYSVTILLADTLNLVQKRMCFTFGQIFHVTYRFAITTFELVSGKDPYSKYRCKYQSILLYFMVFVRLHIICFYTQEFKKDFSMVDKHQRYFCKYHSFLFCNPESRMIYERWYGKERRIGQRAKSLLFLLFQRWKSEILFPMSLVSLSIKHLILIG